MRNEPQFVHRDVASMCRPPSTYPGNSTLLQLAQYIMAILTHFDRGTRRAVASVAAAEVMALGDQQPGEPTTQSSTSRSFRSPLPLLSDTEPERTRDDDPLALVGEAGMATTGVVMFGAGECRGRARRRVTVPLRSRPRPLPDRAEPALRRGARTTTRKVEQREERRRHEGKEAQWMIYILFPLETLFLPPSFSSFSCCGPISPMSCGCDAFQPTSGRRPIAGPQFSRPAHIPTAQHHCLARRRREDLQRTGQKGFTPPVCTLRTRSACRRAAPRPSSLPRQIRHARGASRSRAHPRATTSDSTLSRHSSRHPMHTHLSHVRHLLSHR